jgi:hypothetical protein
LFDLKILRPLQRLAENHPAPYFCVIALLGFSSLGSSFVRDRGAEAILLLVFNSSTFIVGMGFFTCRRQNIDRVAAKHVVLSFRFLSCVGFLAAFIAISTLSAIAGRMLWLKVASRVMLTLPFFVCAMLDCSPRPSALTQFIISVRVQYLHTFCCSKLIQVFCRQFGALFSDTGRSSTSNKRWVAMRVNAFSKWDLSTFAKRQHCCRSTAISFC